MAEIIFILVTIYVAYVIHSAVTTDQVKKDELSSQPPLIPLVKPVIKKAETPVAAKKKPVAKKSKPAKPTAVKATTVKRKASKPKPASGVLRNPETGEEAKIASSYRMCKRWIKEALVTEGLLDKVYKTSEVDEAAKVKINKALTKLAKMEKYQ